MLFHLLLCFSWLSNRLSQAFSVPDPTNVRVLLFITLDAAPELATLVPAATAWGAANNLSITIDFAQTKSTTDYSAVVTSYLKSPKPDQYDIYMIDVVWPGDLAEYLLPLDSYLDNATLSQFDPHILGNDVVGGHYVSLPWYADFGLLYYRQDLLTKYNRTVPKTWDEVEETAGIVLRSERAAQASLVGYVGQLDSYEGLTCNLVEWLASSGGGDMIDEQGKATIANENSEWILQKMRKWIDEEPYIMPATSLVFREQAALDTFAAGNALFMRNWPFCIKQLANAPMFNGTTKSFGFTKVPGRTAATSVGTLGGWHLGVDKGTRHPVQAVNVLKWLTSPDVQKLRAIETGVFPTIPALYNDPAVCEVILHCELFKEVVVAPRPSSRTQGIYRTISMRMYTAVHDYLGGATDIGSIHVVLKALAVDMEKMMGTYVDPARGPPVYVEWVQDVGIAMMSLYVLLILLFLITASAIILNRHRRFIKAASAPFCLLMITGCLMNLSTIFLYTGVPTKLKCVLQPWLLSISFGFIMMGLIEKNWRIFRIFNNPYMKALHFSMIQFAGRAGLVLGVEVIVLAVWTAVDPPMPYRIYLTDYNFLSCRSSSSQFHWTMVSILFVYNFFILSSAVALAYMTRHVRSEYNEARKIALVIWNTTSFALISLAILFVDIFGAILLYTIRSIFIWEMNLFLLICYFGPLIREIILRPSMGATGAQSNIDSRQVASISSAMTNTRPANGLSTGVLMQKTGGNSDSKHSPVGRTISAFTGVLIGRTAKSKLRLTLAAVHHFHILINYNDSFISVIMGDDPKADGLAFYVENIELSLPTLGSQEIYTFNMVVNAQHHFQFMTSNKDVADQWLDRFKSMSKKPSGTQLVSNPAMLTPTV
ncbi:hypothetical protein DFS34DRAFT_644517 [Phlyctochytrium arcticum]|nr:hypothetical protein DFS34DRAFT_644517 [Phlyctochytrium arcticum]